MPPIRAQREACAAYAASTAFVNDLPAVITGEKPEMPSKLHQDQHRHRMRLIRKTVVRWFRNYDEHRQFIGKLNATFQISVSTAS